MAFCTNFLPKIYSHLCNLTIAIRYWIWYNGYASEGERPQEPTEKNQKNSKKLLTNSKLYGIIKTQKGKENPKHQKGIYYG